jgi:hypothetical protein
LADLLLSVRHLRDLPACWAPVYHSSLVLVEPGQLTLVFGGDKGQGVLWPAAVVPAPQTFDWIAPLMTYEDVFQAGHVDFDFSVVTVSVVDNLQYHATRDTFRVVRAAIEAQGLRYDPMRTNCNAVVSTLVRSLGHALPPPPVRGWLPAYGRVILKEA